MTADRALHARALAAVTSLTRPCTHRPEEPEMTDTDMHTENCDPEFGCDETCTTLLPPEEAVRRVLALADELEGEQAWNGIGYGGYQGREIAARIRAAVAGSR